jgi:hypothetical protein
MIELCDTGSNLFHYAGQIRAERERRLRAHFALALRIKASKGVNAVFAVSPTPGISNKAVALPNLF